MNNDTDGAFGALLVGWILGFPTGALRAAVAMKGWEWFVADTFGAPEVSFFQAWGIAMLVSFATIHFSGTKSEYTPYQSVFVGLFLSVLLSCVSFVSFAVIASFL